MEKCKIDYKVYAVDKKIIVAFICLCMVFTGLFCVTIYMDNITLNEIDISSMSREDSGILFSVDKVEINEEFTVIQGWAAKANDDINTFKTHVVLFDNENEKYFTINTEMQLREDVTNQLGGEHNYTRSGFIGKVKNSKLQQGKEYGIYILYENNMDSVLVDINQTLKV